MKMIVSVLIALASAMSINLTITTDAEARRLGGARSFGLQRSMPKQAPKAPRQDAAQTPANGAGAAAAPARRGGIMGPIAGLAAGLGLAALASHLGFGAEFGNIMLIILLAVLGLFLYRKFIASRQKPTYATNAGPMNFEAQQPLSGGSTVKLAQSDFDTDAFTRQAKINFIRLQEAWNRADLDDIRQFVAPEVFAEIQTQLSEEGDQRQSTDIIELNAEVLDLAEENAYWVASVQFTGTLREDGQSPAAFSEIWHMRKPQQGTQGWLLAGIQQQS